MCPVAATPSVCWCTCVADASLVPLCIGRARRAPRCGTGDIAGMSMVVGRILQDGVDQAGDAGAAHYRRALYELSRDLSQTTDRNHVSARATNFRDPLR